MELWDIYDIHKVKTGGVIDRHSEKKLNVNEFHLVVHVCLFNEKGEVLIQKRSSNKSKFAGLWDFTAGGSVLQGETSQQGIQRELYEELGIEYDFSNIRPALTINFKNGFDDVYFITKKVNINDLVLQNDEVEDVKWVNKECVLEMIDNGSFISYYKEYVDLYFTLKEHQGKAVKFI